MEAPSPEGYSSDEGPPELTWDEIQNSVYEFDPVFEFDAPQWFDLSDRKAMYAYDQDTRKGIRDEEGAEEDWFAVEHDGHDPEFYELGAFANDDFTEDIDIGFGAGANSAVTPKKPLGSPKRIARTSPTQPSSPQELSTPSHPRKRALISALSPTALTSKVSSPMRGGALRVPISAQQPPVKTQASPQEGSSPKRNGPQRLLVLESPPPSTTTPPSHSRSVSSPTSISPKTAAHSGKTSSRSPTAVSKTIPRYHDTSKPVHVSQCPPRSMIAVSSHSRRVTAGNVTKRQQQTNTRPQTSSQTKAASSPPAAEHPKMTAVRSPPVPSTENTLLSKVDAVLNTAKNVKQAPAYEPRRFGIKEIKAWEQRSGRRWYELDVEERQAANQEMDDWRRNSAATLSH